MAQSGFTPVIPYYSVTSSNTPTTIVLGELAVNITDKKFFIGTGVNTYTVLFDPASVAITGGTISGISSLGVTGTANFTSTGSLGIPSGTTDERAATRPALRYNISLSQFEGYDGTTWGQIGGGTATNLAGGAANQVPYQTGSGATSFITAPVTAGHVLTYNGSSLAWSAAGIPAGIICLWSGAIGSVPLGWYLCDGSNGTPDLRDRFIVGAGSTYSVSQTGGSADAIVVTHTHTASSVVTDPGHTHGSKYVGAVNTTGTPGGAVAVPTSLSLIPSATTGITVATTNTSTGTSGTNANLPPYYALAYIMKA